MFCNSYSARNLEWDVPQISVDTIPGIPKEILEISARRGITDFEEFFKPSFKGSMPDPSSMMDMDRAIERVHAAIINKEKICVYGDYDVDGATSTAIMLRYFRRIGHDNIIFYIPDRLKEGYGPNSNAIKSLGESGVNLLLIVDSGTTAFDPVNTARSIGMDVVILDHHKAEHTLPDAIVVNPKRQDENGSLTYLCSAGLSFLFLVGLQRTLRNNEFFKATEEPDLKDLLGLVALGTVADIVPLVGLNRAYVKLGLPMMAKNMGIQNLVRETGLTEDLFTPYTCGFVYGPCINAAGRIDDTRLGTLLLSSEDEDEVAGISKRLVELNNERKTMQVSMVQQAIEKAQNALDDSNVVIVYDELWHPGVVGLVASKIKDFFDKSAIVIGTGGKGSARAVDGFDIGQAIIDARLQGLLVAGGGHAAAGGLTINPDNMATFRAFMKERSADFQRPPLKIDHAVQCGQLKASIVDNIQMLAPFGAGNPEPRIAVIGGYVEKVSILKGKHLKGVIKKGSDTQEFILFDGVESKLGNSLLSAQGRYCDIYGKMSVNEYAGKRTVQIRPEDAMIGPALKNEF